jgi:putative endonuclease
MYTLYILKCRDNSLYTGITSNLKRRLSEHRQKKGSKYVASRLPFTLVHTEKFKTKSEVLKREAQIKGWTRNKKLKILKISK